MISSKNANKAIEIMFEHAVKRLNELNESDRRCLYEEYKEWIEGLIENSKGQYAIIFSYIGNT